MIVPERVILLVLAATVYETVPLPLPEPEVSVIQDSDSEGVQAQPVGAVTAKLSPPPEDVNDRLAGEME